MREKAEKAVNPTLSRVALKATQLVDIRNNYLMGENGPLGLRNMFSFDS